MGGEGVGREMAQGVQPATASQRLGLSAAGAGGQITQVPGPEFYTMEWTSNGPRSNLESGLVPGGRSRVTDSILDGFSSCRLGTGFGIDRVTYIHRIVEVDHPVNHVSNQRCSSRFGVGEVWLHIHIPV